MYPSYLYEYFDTMERMGSQDPSGHVGTPCPHYHPRPTSIRQNPRVRFATQEPRNWNGATNRNDNEDTWFVRGRIFDNNGDNRFQNGYGVQNGPRLRNYIGLQNYSRLPNHRGLQNYCRLHNDSVIENYYGIQNNSGLQNNRDLQNDYVRRNDSGLQNNRGHQEYDNLQSNLTQQNEEGPNIDNDHQSRVIYRTRDVGPGRSEHNDDELAPDAFSPVEPWGDTTGDFETPEDIVGDFETPGDIMEDFVTPGGTIGDFENESTLRNDGQLCAFRMNIMKLILEFVKDEDKVAKAFDSQLHVLKLVDCIFNSGSTNYDDMEQTQLVAEIQRAHKGYLDVLMVNENGKDKIALKKGIVDNIALIEPKDLEEEYKNKSEDDEIELGDDNTDNTDEAESIDYIDDNADTTTGNLEDTKTTYEPNIDETTNKTFETQNKESKRSDGDIAFESIRNPENSSILRMDCQCSVKTAELLNELRISENNLDVIIANSNLGETFNEWKISRKVQKRNESTNVKSNSNSATSSGVRAIGKTKKVEPKDKTVDPKIIRRQAVISKLLKNLIILFIVDKNRSELRFLGNFQRCDFLYIDFFMKELKCGLEHGMDSVIHTLGRSEQDKIALELIEEAKNHLSEKLVVKENGYGRLHSLIKVKIHHCECCRRNQVSDAN